MRASSSAALACVHTPAHCVACKSWTQGLSPPSRVAFFSSQGRLCPRDLRPCHCEGACWTNGWRGKCPAHLHHYLLSYEDTVYDRAWGCPILLKSFLTGSKCDPCCDPCSGQSSSSAVNHTVRSDVDCVAVGGGHSLLRLPSGNNTRFLLHRIWRHLLRFQLQKKIRSTSTTQQPPQAHGVPATPCARIYS